MRPRKVLLNAVVRLLVGLRAPLIALACLTTVVGCSPSNAPPGTAVASAAQAVRRQVPDDDRTSELYDLAADEALGGHTLARHIGRTDAQLSERLRLEPDISAASTYTDEMTARRTIARAIEESRRRVDDWASRRGSRPNLVLNYRESSGSPLGRSLRRGQRTTEPCDRALVVLRWLGRENRWIVLTSYPETAR